MYLELLVMEDTSAESTSVGVGRNFNFWLVEETSDEFTLAGAG